VPFGAKRSRRSIGKAAALVHQPEALRRQTKQETEKVQHLTQAQQEEHRQAAALMLQRGEPDASQPEFAGVAGFPLLSFAALLLEVGHSSTVTWQAV